MERTPLKPTGKLYTSNPEGLRRFRIPNAEIWQITRGGYDLTGAKVVRSLSPSPELFRTYVSRWRNLPPEKWWNLYEPCFLKELKTEEKLEGLRAVYKKLLEGKDVVLVCFCEDHRYCHRRLVGEFFEPYGVTAKELNPVTSEQISMF